MTGPLRNEQGTLSGTKLILFLACSLAAAWLVRDLITDRELTEWHTIVLSFLLTIGVANRMNARRVRFNRDGAEKEVNTDDN